MKYRVDACLVALALMTFVAPSVAAQSEPLQKGISVQLAVANSAVAVPDADNVNALIVTISDSGSLYFGIDPTTPEGLAQKIPIGLSESGHRLYIKADARTLYASVVKVLDAAQKAGVEAPILLTGQPEWAQPKAGASPRGLEVLLGPSAFAGAGSPVVQVLTSGEKRPALKVNDRPIAWDKLRHTLEHTFHNRSDKVALVKADGLLPFAQVVHVIDACRSAGATVVLATPAP